MTLHWLVGSLLSGPSRGGAVWEVAATGVEQEVEVLVVSREEVRARCLLPEHIEEEEPMCSVAFPVRVLSFWHGGWDKRKDEMWDFVVIVCICGCQAQHDAAKSDAAWEWEGAG